MQIDGKTKLYGIIGNPVMHSLSPAMHNSAFAALGENRVYLPFPVEDVEAALNGLRGLGICGVSVTIPHKEAVIAFLDNIDPVASRIGAVNTVVVTGEGEDRKLFGSNTDWLGANRALAEKINLAGSRVAILGAGGSARAIGFGLIEAGAVIEIHSRTESKGRALAQVLDCPWISLRETGSINGEVLVNATSVGMMPDNQLSPVAGRPLGNFKVVMDIVYSPLETVLLREAVAAGCSCVNGLEMLLYQGVAQFELWTGMAAPVDVMRMALRQATGNNPSNTANND